MKKLIGFTLVITVVLCGYAFAAREDVYNLAKEQGYDSGYAAGYQEKAEGERYEPRVVVSQRYYVNLIDTAARMFKASHRDLYKRGFKTGFISGYSDSYYGRKKKSTSSDGTSADINDLIKEYDSNPKSFQ